MIPLSSYCMKRYERYLRPIAERLNVRRRRRVVWSRRRTLLYSNALRDSFPKSITRRAPQREKPVWLKRRQPSYAFLNSLCSDVPRGGKRRGRRFMNIARRQAVADLMKLRGAEPKRVRFGAQRFLTDGIDHRIGVEQRPAARLGVRADRQTEAVGRQHRLFDGRALGQRIRVADRFARDAARADPGRFRGRHDADIVFIDFVSKRQRVNGIAAVGQAVHHFKDRHGTAETRQIDGQFDPDESAAQNDDPPSPLFQGDNRPPRHPERSARRYRGCPVS